MTIPTGAQLGHYEISASNGFSDAERRVLLRGGVTQTNGLLKVGGSSSEAEMCFGRAIEVARRQSARALELRAVRGLAALWRRQGKGADALRMLDDIYGWFTEGSDTADMRSVRELLSELSAELRL